MLLLFGTTVLDDVGRKHLVIARYCLSRLFGKAIYSGRQLPHFDRLLHFVRNDADSLILAPILLYQLQHGDRLMQSLISEVFFSKKAPPLRSDQLFSVKTFLRRGATNCLA